MCAAAAPPWFQLYMLKDRGYMRELLARAKEWVLSAKDADLVLAIVDAERGVSPDVETIVDPADGDPTAAYRARRFRRTLARAVKWRRWHRARYFG